MWDLPRPGIKPALQGRFLIPEPQGKFHISVFKTNDYVLHCPGLGVLACFMIRASSGVPWSPQGLWIIHKRKDSQSIVFFCIAPRTWRLKSPPPLWIHLVHSWSDSHLAQRCPHTEGPQECKSADWARVSEGWKEKRAWWEQSPQMGPQCWSSIFRALPTHLGPH